MTKTTPPLFISHWFDSMTSREFVVEFGGKVCFVLFCPLETSVLHPARELFAEDQQVPEPDEAARKGMHRDSPNRVRNLLVLGLLLL